MVHPLSCSASWGIDEVRVTDGIGGIDLDGRNWQKRKLWRFDRTPPQSQRREYGIQEAHMAFGRNKPRLSVPFHSSVPLSSANRRIPDWWKFIKGQKK